MPSTAVRQHPLTVNVAAAVPDRKNAALRKRITTLLEASHQAVAASPAEALARACEARLVAESLGETALLTQCLQAEGIARLWMADFRVAITVLSDVCERSAAIGDTTGEAAARNALGVVYTKIGDPAAALEQYRASLELRRAAGDKAGQAMTLHNIGIEHRALGDLPTARSFYGQALALDRETGDRIGEGRTLVSLGNVQLLLHDLQGASSLFCDALRIARETGDRTNEAQALQSLGETEAAQGHYDEAIGHHRRGLNLSRLLGSPDFEASALSALGKSLRLSGDYTAARETLQESLALSQQVGARRVQSEAWEQLSLVHEALGEYLLALTAYRRYHDTERAILSDETELRTRTLSARMEIEQARYEAELHRLHTVELARQNESLQEQAAQLDREASRDTLTGLANRRALLPRLNDAFAHNRRTGEPLAVAMLDIDHFKQVNDTYTHTVGDTVLRQVARLLEIGCRSGCDVVARYGGEEFVLLLPGISPADAAARCEQIRQSIEAYPWYAVHPALKRVTISIGVCGDQAADKEEDLLAAADSLLYEAKRAGRNQVRALMGVPQRAG